MSMSTVFVDATNRQRPCVFYRDARDPQGDARETIERMARQFSERRFVSDRPRLVRVYCEGMYVKPWRQQKKLDIQYEACGGQPTPDFKPL